MNARSVLIAWAQSEGFAAVHNGQATDEAIVDDLLAYLERQGFEVVERYSALLDEVKWSPPE